MPLSGPDLVSRLTPRIAKQCIQRVWFSCCHSVFLWRAGWKLGVAIGDLLMLHAFKASCQQGSNQKECASHIIIAAKHASKQSIQDSSISKSYNHVRYLSHTSSCNY
jgi:hypothetical protein